jgi:hypothetical protein
MRLPLVFATLAAALAASTDASAYCVHNDLKKGVVTILQEHHQDRIRDDRRLRATLKPGEKVCCEVKQLDCNPNGRENSFVNLAVTIEDAAPVACGIPQGIDKERFVKVFGSGTLRIQDNPKPNATTYVLRLTSHDGKNITGPSGLACPQS